MKNTKTAAEIIKKIEQKSCKKLQNVVEKIQLQKQKAAL